MAGAVAFVFGLCALSFAAGCVVTAIMLRNTDPAEEQRPQQHPTIPQAETPLPEEPELHWPPDDFTSKPIHRNPVMGLRGPPTLHLAPVPDSTTAPLLTLVEQVKTRPPTLSLVGGPSEPHPATESDDEIARPKTAEKDPATDHPTTSPKTPHTLDQPAGRLPADAPTALPPTTDNSAPPTEQPRIPAIPQAIANTTPSDEQEARPDNAKAETQPTTQPQKHHPDQPHKAKPAPKDPAHNKKRREIKLKLVPQPETAQEAAAPPAAMEPDTMFASRSGLVSEQQEATEPLVPEQGVGSKPESTVPAQQTLTRNDEFRKRYLRTFEAARRRSNH